jgi:hypothetical protein
MEDIFDKVGGTKFTGFIFITILGFVLILVKDTKTATDFMAFAFGMFGLYVVGNTISKFSQNGTEVGK